LFVEIYKNAIQELKEAKDYEVIVAEMASKLPNIREMTRFTHHYNPFHFKRYSDLFFEEGNAKVCPTGTCIPLSKKIYVTVDGMILPCEQVGYHVALGKVDVNGVHLDCEDVANLINGFYDKMSQCHNCYLTGKCSQCIFYLIQDSGVGDCPFFVNKESFESFLSDRMSLMEEKPEFYLNSLKEGIDE